MDLLIQISIFVILTLGLGALAKLFNINGVIAAVAIMALVVLGLVIYSGSIDRTLGYVILLSIVSISGLLWRFFRLKNG